MGKKKDLTQGKKDSIRVLFNQGYDAPEIHKILGQDCGTLVIYINKDNSKRKPSSKLGTRVVYQRDLI